MSRSWLLLALLLALATVAGLVAMGSARAAGPSVLARGPEGWLAARAYLEARGVEVTLLDRRPAAGETGPVLVTALPWRRLESGEGLEALSSYALAGGTVVLAYASRGSTLQQERALEALGIETALAREEAPWTPLAWRRWAREEWRLEAPGGGVGSVVVHPPERLPAPPAGARVLYRREGTATAVIWSAPHGDGRLVVLPAEALANGRLGEAGNADLLESLRVWLGDDWTFDEYHHGLLPPKGLRRRVPSLALDLFGLHLALLYALGAWHLARRFGPPWREPPVRTGSVGTFLRGLGRLHHRLGHHRRAAELLLARAQELDPRLRLPPGLAERAAGADGKELVALAREVARARGPRRPG